MKTYTRCAAHTFTNVTSASFSARTYSRLKFGSDDAARIMGYELANDIASKHIDKLISNRVVVIPSPYNFVENAATRLTYYMVNRLNQILVEKNGSPVETSIIHRKVSYINDYGFLSKEKRKGLIDNDSFYINKDFTKGKLFIFVDDVLITGTHEDKLKEILEKEQLPNDAIFAYYAQYCGNNPEIEAAINFADIKDTSDFISLTQTRKHRMLVRPIKYILGLSPKNLRKVLKSLNPYQIEELYNGCLGEGYFKIPNYQANFNAIKKSFLCL